MRAAFLSIIPNGESGKYFGLYSSFERFSTILGPALWLSVASICSELGPSRYRISMLVMGLLVVLSVFYMRKAQEYSPL